MRLKFWELRCRDNWYPRALGVTFGAAVAILLFCTELTPPKRIQELSPALLNVSAIATGFLATVGSILLTFSKSIISDMKETGEYGLLMQYLVSSLRWSLFLALYSALGILLSFNHLDLLDRIYLSGLAFFSSTCFLASYRVVSIFTQIIRHEDA